MKLAVYNLDKKEAYIDVNDALYGREYNQAVVHQVINSLLNNAHTGTKQQKTRSEVSGGGAKPWKQKGGGRARAGSIRSPLWRGGGKIFAAKPFISRDKINKKMYKAAFACVISELIRENRIQVVHDDVLKLSSHKTKEFLNRLNQFADPTKDVLILLHGDNKNLLLAAQNVPKVRVLVASEVNPAILIAHEQIIATVSSIEFLQKVQDVKSV